ncbi:MAG TPA: hypothetical protein HA224_00930 [Nanoarchaeota archaeon]|nr:hypothetical protein [Nanoarchaeota archaeon]
MAARITTTTVRITKAVKQQLDEAFDPKKWTYSEALKNLLASHKQKWNWFEFYVAVVVTLVLIFELAL